MSDADIRAVVDRQVTASGALAVHELGILTGSVRIDVAAVGASLGGFEIKSATDTLRRLPAQVEAYSAVLDFAAVVVTENHLRGALSIVPTWWGVAVASSDGADVAITPLRDATDNPVIHARSLVELLWHADAIALLDRKDAARGVRGRARARAWDRVVEVCTLDEIRAEVRARLRARNAPMATPCDRCGLESCRAWSQRTTRPDGRAFKGAADACRARATSLPSPRPLPPG